MFINYNGTILPVDAPIITADNPGLKYGYGLFETMKASQGNVRLFKLHMDRLLHGVAVLQLEIPIIFTDSLPILIQNLCNKNNCFKQLARIRLNVFGGSSMLGERSFNYIIEAYNLDDSYAEFNEEGVSLGVYSAIQKSCDILANLKMNNYLPYRMARRYANANKLDDCLLLNTHGRICDSTIANVFGIKGKKIITPSLSEGCVAGVMRKHLLQKLPGAGYDVQEQPLTVQELKECNEIFLTNALVGIKPVKLFDGQEYAIKMSALLYNEFIKTHFSK